MQVAYVCAISGGDAYLPGLLALGASLRASGSTVPMVALVSADVSPAARARLRTLGWQLRDIEPLHVQGVRPLYPRFDEAFVKLRAWQLTEFDKVVLLDADTLVVRNIDDLFERPPLAAAPDFLMPDRFNSGVMVLRPSQTTFAAMVAALDRTQSYDGGDQGFLNGFFDDWYASPVAHRLPAGYNLMHFIVQFLRGHPVLRDALEREARVIHYAVQKPWHGLPVVTGCSADWWAMYQRAEPAMATPWRQLAHQLEDQAFNRVIDWLVR
jgi:alpha-N-acetylglucosamine transferase